MKTRQEIAEELLEKQERVNAWEHYRFLDNERFEEAKVDHWYMD